MTWPDLLHRESPRESCLPVGESLQKAVLKIAAAKWSVALQDDATDSITVLMDGSPAFWINDIGELQTTLGRFEVRVESIVRVEGDRDATAAKRVKFRVGLRRLREVAGSADDADRGRTASMLRGLVAAVFPQERNNVVTGIALGALLIATPLVLATLAWHHNAPMTEELTRWATALLPGRKPAEVVTSADADLRDAIKRLPGLEAFLLPEVAEALQLTGEQRAALMRLSEAMHKALKDFEVRWRGDTPAEQARKKALILDAASQESLRLLTDSQRERWKQLAP